MPTDLIREYSLDLPDDDGPTPEELEDWEWDEADRVYHQEGER